jgi:hypothetical protein
MDVKVFRFEKKHQRINIKLGNRWAMYYLQVFFYMAAASALCSIPNKKIMYAS